VRVERSVDVSLRMAGFTRVHASGGQSRSSVAVMPLLVSSITVRPR
jgi:hypothetical protein